MKEMTAARDNRNRKCLRPGPIHHGGQLYGVVLLAVQDERSGVRISSDRRSHRPADAGADQHQAGDVARIRKSRVCMSRNKCAKRKPREANRPLRCGSGDYRQHVFKLAPALVMLTFSAANTAKVEAYSRPATLREGTGQGLHNFVVHAAAEQRVRMCDHRDTF